jgi:hypothetical protein
MAGVFVFEPIKRALTPQLAAGLASVYKISIIPYGRRFPAACCRVFKRDVRVEKEGKMLGMLSM